MSDNHFNYKNVLRDHNFYKISSTFYGRNRQVFVRTIKISQICRSYECKSEKKILDAFKNVIHRI